VHQTTYNELISADVKFHEYTFPSVRDAHQREIIQPVLLPGSGITRDPSRSMVQGSGIARDPSRAPPAAGAEIGPDEAVEYRGGNEVPSNTQAPPAVGAETCPDDMSRAVRSHDELRAVESVRVGDTDLAMEPVHPIYKTTRSGRVPKQKVFADAVVGLPDQEPSANKHQEKARDLGRLAPTALLEDVSIEEALRLDEKGWQRAMLRELKSLKETRTYSIVPIPEKRRVISSKWVLRNKYGAGNQVIRQKARLVIKGYEQQYGLDYFDTFASVVRYTTLRILLAKAAAENLEIRQLDVETAFLNPDLEVDIYMELPEFFELLEDGGEYDPKTHCLKLNKSLYGLKQAPRVWQSEVREFFKELGFTSSTSDPNYFVAERVTDKGEIHILLFVDDMLLIGTSNQVNSVKASILARWKCQDLGEAQTFIGIQIERDRENKSLQIHQTRYIDKMLRKFGMLDSNPNQLPFPAGTVLFPYQNTEDTLDKDQSTLYRQITGSLLYLSTCTRFDTSYASNQLARHMAKPQKQHLALAKKVLRYLRGTMNLWIHYEGRQAEKTYKLFSDATWATEWDKKSIQGWVVVRAGGAVSWVSQRQKSTSQSSMEAELIAANELAKEAAWLEKVTEDLREPSSIPTLRIDNQGTIDLIHDPKHHNRAKHIETRAFFIRDDMVGQGRLAVEHIPGNENPADILTKQLPVGPFTTHLKNLGLYGLV
jgi:hypothetical protein